MINKIDEKDTSLKNKSYKDEFLKRKFRHDQNIVYCRVLTLISLFVAFFVLGGIMVFAKSLMPKDEGHLLGWIFLLFFLGLGFGLFNLYRYIGLQKMFSEYGVFLYGDIDNKWLKEEQGYGIEVFEEIHQKELDFSKLGANTLRTTISTFVIGLLSVIGGAEVFVIIVSIIIYAVKYETYRNKKQVFFYEALADRCPRAYRTLLFGENGQSSSGMVSRILKQRRK